MAPELSASEADVQRRKKALRRTARERRILLPEDERRRASDRIADRLVHSRFFYRSRWLGCYLAMAEEVSTWGIIERAWRRNKRIFAPVTRRRRQLEFREVAPDTDLVRNDFGLLEPVEGPVVGARQLDAVLMPLVAFDEQGYRIGMGGGYYDRTFSFLRHRHALTHPRLVGLAFDCQRVEKIPVNPWDIKLHAVITECS